MDELDFELKHLLKWVGASTPPPASQHPPVGFYESVMDTAKLNQAQTPLKRLRTAVRELTGFLGGM